MDIDPTRVTLAPASLLPYLPFSLVHPWQLHTFHNKPTLCLCLCHPPPLHPGPALCTLQVCPPGCDQGVYEKVCDLREKRLDEEDMVAEFQKTIELLKKEKEGLSKKQRLVEQSLGAVNAEMAEFQREKQVGGGARGGVLWGRV